MTDTTVRMGYVTPTTPSSSPLDTLKANAMRTIQHLEHVIDELAGSEQPPSEDVLDLLDGIKQQQYRALAEHVPVARDERLGELRYVHPDGYKYDDGSMVVEQFENRFGTVNYFTRYDGTRSEVIQRFEVWTSNLEQQCRDDASFDNIVRDADWGRDDPTQDL